MQCDAEAVARIERMEQAYDRLRLGDADEAERAELRRMLEDYCDSGLWLADYDRDARGELPADLKRGVLAQDGLYELLCGEVCES